jgi:hypothetical protein
MKPPRGEKMRCQASHNGENVSEKNWSYLEMVPKVCAQDIPEGDKDWKAAEPMKGRKGLGVSCYATKQGKKTPRCLALAELTHQ